MGVQIAGFAEHLQRILQIAISFERPTSSLEEDLAVSFTKDNVLEDLLHLKLGKSDDTVLSSDYFIHAAPSIPDSLASLFTALVHHGYMPVPQRRLATLTETSGLA